MTHDKRDELERTWKVTTVACLKFLHGRDKELCPIWWHIGGVEVHLHSFLTPLNRRLGGPQSQSGRFGEKRSLVYAGVRTQARSTSSLVAVSTYAYWIRINCSGTTLSSKRLVGVSNYNTSVNCSGATLSSKRLVGVSNYNTSVNLVKVNWIRWSLLMPNVITVCRSNLPYTYIVSLF